MKPNEFARFVVEEYIMSGKVPKSQKLSDINNSAKAGAFVSIHTKFNELRGCIGTIIPVRDNVVDEIIHNAIAAATKDPRFQPVTKKELSELNYSVDVLSPLEQVKLYDSLNSKIYGIVIKTKSNKSAVLLPNLDGINTAEEQIAICKSKGNIDENEEIDLYRFTVKRFG